jgi:O-antigen/teichoic acid export membrane protein
MANVDQSLKLITKGTGIIFAGIFISKLLNYGYRLIAARLGTDAYGMLSIALGVFGFAVMIGALGIPSGVLRYVAFYKGKDEENKIRGTIFASLKLTIFSSIITMILLLVFSRSIAINIFHSEELVTILRIIALGIPFYILGAMFNNILRGFQQLKYEVYSQNIAEPIAKIALTGILILLGYGILGATYAYLFGLIISASLLFIFMEKKVFSLIKKRFKSIYPNKIYKRLLIFSIPLTIGSLLTMFVAWMDTFMIGYFMNTSNVGLYNAITPTIQLMNIFPMALTAIFFPKLTELLATGKKENLASIYKTVTKWVLLFNLFLMPLFLLFPEQILGLLFGKEYTASAIPMIILSGGYFISYFLFTSVYLLMTMKRTNLILINSIIIVAINILLNLFLIPKYGLIGAALATSISFIIMALLVLAEINYIIKIVPFNWKYPKIGFAFIISLISTKLVFNYAETLGFSGVLLSFGLFSISFIVLLAITKSFEREDIMIMEAIENKTGMYKIFSRFIKKFS